MPEDLDNQKSSVRQTTVKRDDALIQSFSNEKGVGYIDTWYDSDANLASIGQYKQNGSCRQKSNFHINCDR